MSQPKQDAHDQALLENEELDREVQGRKNPSKSKSFILLGCGLLVLFVQWMLMTFFMPFFALSGPGSKISDAVQGFIYAAFPAGTAVAAPFIGTILVKFGTRNTVLVGLVLMAFFIMLFGCIPTIVNENSAMPALLVITGFAYGAVSSLAETGTYAILTYSYPNILGKIFAASEIMVGAGSTLGPVFGGVLYDQLSSLGDEDQFMVTCIIFGVVSLLAIVPIVRYMPNTFIDEGGEGGTALCDVFTGPVFMTCTAVFVTGMSFSSISPVMALRLQNKPFHLSVGTTGTIFLVGGLVYMAVATPLGFWVDRQNRTGRMRFVMAVGLCMLGLGFLLDGPLRVSGVSLDFLDNMPAFLLGQLLLGLGQAAVLIPCLPEMVAPFPEEEEALRATVTGLQVSAYALGSVLGPIASTALLHLETPTLCRTSDWPLSNSTIDAQEQQHCFDGFCTLFFFVYLICGSAMFLHAFISKDADLNPHKPAPTRSSSLTVLPRTPRRPGARASMSPTKTRTTM